MGVPWAEYWTKLPTVITGGDVPDLAWMHDTRGERLHHAIFCYHSTDFISANKPIDWPDAFDKLQVVAFNTVVSAISSRLGARWSVCQQDHARRGKAGNAHGKHHAGRID